MYKIKRELTPKELLCGPYIPGCPALYELEDGSLIVIGKIINNDQLQSEVSARIANDEIAVHIPRNLIGR